MNRKNDPCRSGGGGDARAETAGSTPRDDQWKTARNRMLGYLDAMDVPPVEALQLSLRIIEQVRSENPGAAEPRLTARAMEALRQTLVEQGRLEADGFVLDGAEEALPQACPDLNPGRMIPQKLRSRRRALVPGWVHKIFNPTLRVLILLILTG